MMKKLFVSVFLIGVPVALLAQTPTKVVSKSKRPHASRVEIKSTATQMATGIMAAETAISPTELAIAQRVYLGKLPCELGAFVTLTADAKSPGYFDVYIRNLKFRMSPVQTSTGAIRLEDAKGGAVWLQLSNKSMLMNQKLGQRLADECMNPDQAVVAAAMFKNPPPSLLDAPATTTTTITTVTTITTTAPADLAEPAALAVSAEPAAPAPSTTTTTTITTK